MSKKCKSGKLRQKQRKQAFIAAGKTHGNGVSIKYRYKIKGRNQIAIASSKNPSDKLVCETLKNRYSE